MLKKMLLLLAAAVLIPLSTAWAIEISGITVADTMETEETELLLNGAGIRKKFFINVYAGALYLENKEAEPEAIINGDAPMAIRMLFIHSKVTAKKLIKAWNDGFAKATGSNIGPIRREINAFNELFNEDALKGDIYDIVYTPGAGTEIFIKGTRRGVIEGLYFKKALFAIWLGEDPADASLKKGMLGR